MRDDDFPMFSVVCSAGCPPGQWCSVDPDVLGPDDETPVDEAEVPQAVRDWAARAVVQPGRDMLFLVGLRRGGGVELVNEVCLTPDLQDLQKEMRRVLASGGAPGAARAPRARSPRGRRRSPGS